MEKQNNIAINVFGWNGRVIVHQLSKQPYELPRINLTVIEKDEKEGLRFHYKWIKSLSRLLHDHVGRKLFCERCLVSEDLLQRHKPECRGNGERAVRIEMTRISRLT